jgi:uncharacterized protein with von Willebrand factor type A (vWA) domain
MTKDQTHVAFLLGGPARGSHKNNVGLDRILFRRRRRLWEILQRRFLDSFLLRVSGLLEGDVVSSKLEAFTVA